MEFEEMQKIWNEQKGETMYAIDESALHRSITRKKNNISRKVSIVELSLMAINSAVAIFLLIDAIVKGGLWDYGGAVIMGLTVLFLYFFRQRRKSNENTFDRSILGELDHAIANSQSILQIATTMIYYYLIPTSILAIGKMIYFGASIDKWLLITGLYTLAFFLVRWEKRAVHIPRKNRLEVLKKKILEG